MSYSKPTQMLVDEHEVICAVLDAVEAMARHETDAFPQAFFEKAFDFFPVFADKCHHAKEEAHLFPMLEARGIPREHGPIGCMLSEHEQGRALVAAVKDGLKRTRQGDGNAEEVVRQKALEYVDLLRQHIQKENIILFPLGDQRMTDQDEETLWHKFHCAEHEAVPAGTHEKYLALAKELQTTANLQCVTP